MLLSECGNCPDIRVMMIAKQNQQMRRTGFQRAGNVVGLQQPAATDRVSGVSQCFVEQFNVIIMIAENQDMNGRFVHVQTRGADSG
jgi:hypothetical protein